MIFIEGIPRGNYETSPQKFEFNSLEELMSNDYIKSLSAFLGFYKFSTGGDSNGYFELFCELYEGDMWYSVGHFILENTELIYPLGFPKFNHDYRPGKIVKFRGGAWSVPEYWAFLTAVIDNPKHSTEDLEIVIQWGGLLNKSIFDGWKYETPIILNMKINNLCHKYWESDVVKNFYETHEEMGNFRIRNKKGK